MFRTLHFYCHIVPLYSFLNPISCQESTWDKIFYALSLFFFLINVVPDITNPHFAKLVLEIEKKLFEYSYLTVICNTNEVKELEQKHVDTLISQRVSGILIISGCKTYDLIDIPVIYVDRCPDDYRENQHCIVESPKALQLFSYLHYYSCSEHSIFTAILFLCIAF